MLRRERVEPLFAMMKDVYVWIKRTFKKTLDPKHVLLFGSYASGRANEYSDVDVLVVSDRFASIPKEKRLDLLYPMTADLYPDFHVFGMTLREYEAMSPLAPLAEAKRFGRPIL